MVKKVRERNGKGYKDTKIYKNIKLKQLIYRYNMSNKTAKKRIIPENSWRGQGRMYKEEEYPWNELKESIEKDGVLKPIEVHDLELPDVKRYRVIDGNHRVKVLMELYGEDYIQKCVIVKAGRMKCFETGNWFGH